MARLRAPRKRSHRQVGEDRLTVSAEDYMITFPDGTILVVDRVIEAGPDAIVDGDRFFGRAVAEPLEAPFLLVAILLSAWVTLRWFPLEPHMGVRRAVGGISLVMVLLTELALSPFVRGSVQAWFDSFTTLTLALSILLWIAHVGAPALVRR